MCIRDRLLELALGIANSSKLTDCVDGELKSFTQGESIAVIQLIIEQVPLSCSIRCATFITGTVGLTLLTNLDVCCPYVTLHEYFCQRCHLDQITGNMFLTIH